MVPGPGAGKSQRPADKGPVISLGKGKGGSGAGENENRRSKKNIWTKKAGS